MVTIHRLVYDSLKILSLAHSALSSGTCDPLFRMRKVNKLSVALIAPRAERTGIILCEVIAKLRFTFDGSLLCDFALSCRFSSSSSRTRCFSSRMESRTSTICSFSVESPDCFASSLAPLTELTRLLTRDATDRTAGGTISFHRAVQGAISS